jgi:hypothetical protein
MVARGQNRCKATVDLPLAKQLPSGPERGGYTHTFAYALQNVCSGIARAEGFDAAAQAAWEMHLKASIVELVCTHLTAMSAAVLGKRKAPVAAAEVDAAAIQNEKANRGASRARRLWPMAGLRSRSGPRRIRASRTFTGVLLRLERLDPTRLPLCSATKGLL